MFSVVEILEEFVEAARIGVIDPFSEAEGKVSPPLESIRRAYRARNHDRGQCRSCPRPAAPGRASCSKHLEKANARARASQARREAA